MKNPFVLALCLAASAALSAQHNPTHATAPDDPAAFERRVSNRSSAMVEKLNLSDETTKQTVRDATIRFYRELSDVHARRDKALAALSGGYATPARSVQFDSEKEAHAVYGRYLGTLATVLDDGKIEAVKDAMTFNLVEITMGDYRRMFPDLQARHASQLRAWLEDCREAAVTAGSAETKLDVLRVTNARVYAYLEAQGYDTVTALKAEAALKAAKNAQEAKERAAN